MAKAKQKQVAASILSVTTSRLSAAFQHGAFVAYAKSEEDAGTAAESLAAILAMRAELSGAEYVAGIESIFGTVGIHHAKPDYVAGTLRADLVESFKGEEDPKKFMDRIKMALSRARNVGSWLADPVNYAKALAKDKDGETPTLNALDTLRKGPKKTRDPKTPDADAPSETTVITAASAIEAVIAQFGFAAACVAMADAMNATKGAKFTADNLRALAKVAA